MAQVKLGAAGVTAREIDLSGPTATQPVGVPAGVIGTSLKGPAFVPVTFGSISEYFTKFGDTDGEKFGPLAVNEWMRNAGAVTYLKVLGCGNGKRRTADGSVTSAGFTVGEEQPLASVDGALSANAYANAGGPPGRTYFLGCFMSESIGSTIFSSAGLQGTTNTFGVVSSSIPIVRGVIMAPSGVIIRLSSSFAGANAAPASTFVASDTYASGALIGSVVLSSNSVSKQEFVLLLNGHKGTDPLYPNVLTASFDVSSPSYFTKKLNTDPEAFQQAGHYLYAHWDVHPSQAEVTGSGLVANLSGAFAATAKKSGAEACAFLTTSSLARDTGDSYVPNYESFKDRFRHAVSPWVISQKFGGKYKNLFKFHALDDGTNVSTLYKISIENIKPGDSITKFGTFDVVLRTWDDKDSNQKVLERWSGLDINPNSPNYISKKIGDLNVYYDFDRSDIAQKLVVDGNYVNNSKYVRVEVSTDVEEEAVDATALPFGFRGHSHLATSGSMPLASPDDSELKTTNVLKHAVQPPVPFRTSITQGTGAKQLVDSKLYWGVQFEHATTLTTPNASTLANDSIKSFAKYFPDFATTTMPVVVGDNTSAADTAENGIVDADRFNNNLFTLENIQVVTGSDTYADPQQWASAVYVRNGSISSSDSAKTRRLSVSDFTTSNTRFLKFSMFMQGGFDGTNIFDEDESNINDAAVRADMLDSDRGLNYGPNVMSYIKAIDIMKDVSSVEMKLLTIPGIRQPVVTDYATQAVQDRFDALFLMDVQQYDNTNVEIVDYTASSDQQVSVQNTTSNFINRALDSSFAAAYFPDVIVTDPTTKTNVVVPPSVVVMGAFALNDSIGHPWFAPAGFTRGALSTTVEASTKLSKENLDVLYDAKINPLVAFVGNNSPTLNPSGGVVVWGQKTLQQASSALDRVNVRRLLIEIRRTVRDIAQTIVFEPNRESTLAKFSAAVTPKLQIVQSQAGLKRFKVVIDSSTTTQQDVENNTIRGKIYVQPYRSIETVSLDFLVQNPGTTL